MARISVETLDSAPVDAIATGSLLLVDDNGVPYKVQISDINSGGGTGASLLVRTDTTPVVTGRLLSPGNLVEGLSVTLSLDGAAAKTAVTDANGDFTYDFTAFGTRGIDHTLKVTASAFLIKNITGWHWDLLAANTVTPVTTGSALVGSTLTVNPGTWANNPTTFLYRWLRGSYLIPGANASRSG
jgi:autotransporter adhesin